MNAALAAQPRAEQLIDVDENDSFSPWATKQYLDKYSWKDEKGNPTEVWPDTAYRTVRHVLGALGYTDHDSEFQDIQYLVVNRKFMPAGRYLANSGKPRHMINNCFMYRCADSISDQGGWADLVSKCIKSLSAGGGVGVVYSDVRPYGTRVKATGNMATGPLSPASMVNEVAHHVMAGSRRGAIWGGLHWDHSDIFKWIHAKDWSAEIHEAKAKDYNFSAPLDMTNISVILNDDFFAAYKDELNPMHEHARRVYHETISSMLSTGEPGFSIDTGENTYENLRNPCCEITSEDDSDVCNLGSINMSRINDIDEFREAVRMGTLLLLAGTVYSDVPHEEIRTTRAKNRRIGLGLMGMHEWLLKRGYRYEVVPELHEWLAVYRDESDQAAEYWAGIHNLSMPKKKRAIAPNGTIGLIAETTTGIEPIFCVAEKRRFIDNDQIRRYQYVINPTAARLIKEHGINPADIEDAYALSYDYERRIKFQYDCQQYVDHGISSTLNMPYPMTDPEEIKEFGKIFMKYAPGLRGMTVYPDGARAGQPLTPCSYNEAKDRIGVSYEDDRESCIGGLCGI